MAIYEQDIIVLVDEEGNETEFEVVDFFEVDSQQYAVLYPVDEELDEAIIMRVEEDEDGEEILVDIEDDEEWERVVAAYDELLDDEYDDFEDDEDEQ